jgi:uncharacterized protein (TIGR03086 family)
VNLPELHQHALDSTGTIVGRIAGDQLDLASPCDPWSVRELLDHVVSGNYWAAELGTGKTIDDVGGRLDGDTLGPDPQAAYRESSRLAAAAFDAPGAMDAPCAVSYGPVPGSVYCGHRIIDVAVHGWDLARATGPDETIAPDLVDTIAAVVAPQLDMLNGSGMFGTAVAVDARADAQTRLLAQLGRG